MEDEEKKPIHISVAIEGEGTHTSFYFKDATIGQLALINAELDILKKELVDRIDECPKDYEVKEF